jgi:hypothetical protein
MALCRVIILRVFRITLVLQFLVAVSADALLRICVLTLFVVWLLALFLDNFDVSAFFIAALPCQDVVISDVCWTLCISIGCASCLPLAVAAATTAIAAAIATYSSFRAVIVIIVIVIRMSMSELHINLAYVIFCCSNLRFRCWRLYKEIVLSHSLL